MKIIYIANARMPTEKAHGLQAMKMCETFASYNIEVELIVPRRINWIKEGPFDYYGLKRSFEIKKLPCLDLIPLDRYIGHLGLWIESITFFLSLLPYIFLKKADIIYTRDKSVLPLVLFKRNFFFEAHTFPKNYFLYSPFLKRLKRVVVITQKLKELFVDQGMPENKILIAPDGVDLEEFEIKKTQNECQKKLSLPSNKKIVLYTGHLYGWKGVNDLAEASQYLPENTQVYFVGGTEKDIKQFKIQNAKFKIEVVGHRPHKEIPHWLKSADVLVLPNSAKAKISKYWTSPLKLFEYMASGRPIVASDLPSICEILNEKNAILVKPDDPKELAGGIEKALGDKNLAERISTKAFQDAQNYTWQKRTKSILEFMTKNRF